MKKIKYILASSSPRRKQILSKIIDNFDVVVPEINEICNKTKPQDIVVYLAKLKGKEACNLVNKQVIANNDEIILISSDTLVSLNDEILGKPQTKDEAYEMLSSLQGNWHTVFTGVAIYRNAKNKWELYDAFYDKAKVQITNLTGKEINDYIATGSPMDKAGAYGIQDLNGQLVSAIKGSYYNVMGLPLEKLAQKLDNLKKAYF